MSDTEREQKDREIKDLKDQVSQLSAQIDFLSRQLFGRKSEKGIPDHPDQLNLFDDAIEGSDGDEDVEDLTEGSDDDDSSSRKKITKRDSRKSRLPEGLPIDQAIIDPDEVLANPDAYKCIGEVHTDRLAFRPPVYFIKRITRRKFVRLTESETDTGLPIAPVVAPLPPQLVERGLADSSFVAHILVSKYRDHLPLDRQEKINRERYGIDISKQTLCNMVSNAAECLRLIYVEMARAAFEKGYVQIDETPIKYQEPGRGKTATGYFWAIHSPGNDSIYHWKLGRSTECLEEIVPPDYRGIIQCDAYRAYTKLASRRNAVELCACLAHIRRKFWEASEQGQNPAFNRWVIEQIKALYRIESRLRKAEITGNLRQAIRSSQSQMIFNRLGKLFTKVQRARRFLPKSLTGRAVSYALDQWQRMRVWLTNGNVEIDNNLVENQIRPTKLGMKNWLFIGSAKAGETSAIIYTIIASCVKRGIEPYRYLNDVLQRLPSMKNSEIRSISPMNWSPA